MHNKQPMMQENEEKEKKNCDDFTAAEQQQGKKKTSCKKNIAAIALVSLAIAQSQRFQKLSKESNNRYLRLTAKLLLNQ